MPKDSKYCDTSYDAIVIGSGAAGLGVALSLAPQARVAIITKKQLANGASPYAQGGIAAVIDQTDSWQQHLQDTLNVGCGLSDQKVVEFVVKNAKRAIEWLMQHGVQFTTENGQLHLTQEGGHSHRRILHVQDRTGSAVIKSLSEQALDHPNITCFTEHTAIDLIIENNRCFGVMVLDNKTKNIKIFSAKNTVLATGGASSIYYHTSNPDINYGDGIAMAWRAGCQLANLEFQQFHPTCLCLANAPRFLISEAVRGEGGQLILQNGKRFMCQYDPRGELASRDVVARAIWQELIKNNCENVYLDISHKPATFLQQYFPTIYQRCLSYGIDITQQPIPIVPAAHYSCGGIVTNLQGQTNIKNCYAVGEAAYTGLHGANRMASNSLLECLVFAFSCAKAIKNSLLDTNTNCNIHSKKCQFTFELTAQQITTITEIRQILWRHVGIIRSANGLAEATAQLDLIKSTIHIAQLDLTNLIQLAELTIAAAKARQESRGLHYRSDFPALQGSYNTLLKKSPHGITIQHVALNNNAVDATY